MTATETDIGAAPTRAEEPAADAGEQLVAPGLPAAESILTTADHKRIGLAYLALGLLAFLVVRGVGAVVGIELTARGVDIVGDAGNRFHSLHETGIVLLVLQPLWLGLATFLVPLQVGATRLAFPRVQALAFWTHLFGAALFVLAHAVDPLPGGGLTSPRPLEAVAGGTRAGTDLLVASLAMLGLATILAAGNLLATQLAMRTEGMTLLRMPLLSWGVAAWAAGTLLATPIFMGGVLLLFFDMHYGGTSLFGSPDADLVWQHALWLYGRPEIFLLVLPALGAASDIVVAAARRPLADPPVPPLPAAAKAPPPPTGHGLVAGSLVAVAVLSFLTLAQGRAAQGALLLPTATLATAVVALPLVQIVLAWAGTLGQARARPTLPLGFVVAALVVLGAAAANAVVAALAGVEGSALATGQVELSVIAVATLLVAGAVHHWGPKLFGAPLSAAAGGLVLLAWTAGALAVGGGWAIAGYAGAGRHVVDWTDGDWQAGFVVAAVGYVLLLLGGLVLVADVVRAMVAGSRAEPRPADLSEGLTLEWATPTPVPAHDFDEVPEVRSSTPLLDHTAKEA